MEKRTGWGAEYSPEKRNGFQAFIADKSVNHNDNIDRCLPVTNRRSGRTSYYARSDDESEVERFRTLAISSPGANPW